MSEFSESYHLRTARAHDAVELLRRAGRKGYVFPPVAGWVTFVAEGSEFLPDEAIVEAAQHPLLHYMCAEDHGWGFTLLDGTRTVCRYLCEWTDDMAVDDTGYFRAALLRYVPSAQQALLDEFEQQLHPDDMDQVMEAEPAKLFAQALGLQHFDWVAYDYVARDMLEAPEAVAEVIAVE
jgi:hypothetical protein